MSGRAIDLSGRKYGYLTVIKRVFPNRGVKALWECLCSCGNITNVTSPCLTSSNTKSCGCYRKEQSVKRLVKFNLVHGLYGTRIYRSWNMMIQRCLNPNNTNYKYYGGRGITVCERWRNSFADFYKDMGERPNNTSIERRDNNGNYEPRNCYWATRKEQRANRRIPVKKDYE